MFGRSWAWIIIFVKNLVREKLWPMIIITDKMLNYIMDMSCDYNSFSPKLFRESILILFCLASSQVAKLVSTAVASKFYWFNALISRNSLELKSIVQFWSVKIDTLNKNNLVIVLDKLMFYILIWRLPTFIILSKLWLGHQIILHCS